MQGKMQGRGAKIDVGSSIVIGNFENYSVATGRYIRIWSTGDIDVGECDLSRENKEKGTKYYPDGFMLQYPGT